MITFQLCLILFIGTVSAVDLKHFDLLAKIKSADDLLENLIGKTDKMDMTLCEKHIEITLNQSQTTRGWAFRSKNIIFIICASF